MDCSALDALFLDLLDGGGGDVRALRAYDSASLRDPPPLCTVEYWETGNVADPPHPVVAKKKPASLGSNGNTVRKRQRLQIQELRATALQFEKQLKELKEAASRGSASSSSSPSSCRSHDEDEEDRCSREYRRKLKVAAAESSRQDNDAAKITALENIHLNKLVNDHNKVMEQFEKVLHKQRSLSASDILGSSMLRPCTSAPSYLYPQREADAPVFEMMEKNVEARYHQLEQVFKEAGLTENPVEILDAQVGTSLNGGAFVNFKTSRIIPFSVAEINEVAMILSKNAAIMNLTGGTSHIFKQTEKSLAYQKQFDLGDVRINVRGVSKRYHEKNGRTVVIWDGISEWPSESTGQIITIEEKGWAAIKPYPQSRKSSKAASSPVSLFQSYVCMTPDSTEKATKEATQSDHIAVLGDVVLPLYKQIFKARRQLMENALLERSIQRRLRV
ncbi:hypothetical protein FI667_g11885, partial [Globisporangium splendens]